MTQSGTRLALDQIRVATPCTASWDAMDGDDRVRHCKQCRRDVFNLSSLTLAEAEDLIWRTERRICARFYRRADGTILTADCRGGRRPAWQITAWLAGTGVLLAAVVSLLMRTPSSPSGATARAPSPTPVPTTQPAEMTDEEMLRHLQAMGYIGSDDPAYDADSPTTSGPT